ncbi:MAG: sigma-54 interaction domain-containing protein [Myxococcota bacterium]
MFRFHDLVSANQGMRECFEQARAYAACAEPVVILGESGTGKEGLARGLHLESGRSGAFVALNCGALAASLVDSELFGYARGAFTGATTERAGAFEDADRGTLFLDELGELPSSVQIRLLRVLEARAVRRIGESKERSVDVRIVAATHRPLNDLVQQGLFREDLFHRLFVLPIRIPPLRERPEDVRLLAEQFLPQIGILTEGALQALESHAWPGNVRELRNTVVRAHLRARGRAATCEDVVFEAPICQSAPSPVTSASVGGHLVREQIRMMQAALSDAGGNRAQAARNLGLPRSTFCDRLRRWGLEGHGSPTR